MKISAVKGAQVDSSGLSAHLKDYIEVMGKSMTEVIRRQAALFCQDMIAYSRPFSGTSPGDGATLTAREHGAENVRKSIYKIFRPIDRATRSQIADLGDYNVFKLWNKRKGQTVQGKGKNIRWQKFQQKFARGDSYAFIGPGDVGAIQKIHTNLRIDGGHGSLTSEARRAKQPFAIVAKDSDLEKYVKKKQKDVGFLKSAYWIAATNLGEKIKAPAWAKHGEASSNAISIKLVADPAKPSFIVGNKIGKRAGNANFVQVAINHRAYSMRAEMAAKLNKEKVSLWSAAAEGRLSNTYHLFT